MALRHRHEVQGVVMIGADHCVMFCPKGNPQSLGFGTATMQEHEVEALIKALKQAKATAWPKPLKALCPASAELLTYLKRHSNVTPIKAREELGIEHLPRRVKDLKEHGYNIKTRIKRGHSGKRYARYELEGV
jgi:ribonuclease HI